MNNLCLWQTIIYYISVHDFEIKTKASDQGSNS